MSEIKRRVIGMDVRIFYLIGLLVIVIPYLHPIGLPIPVNDRVKVLYNYLTNLPPGSVVMIEQDGDPTQWADVRVGILAGMKLLLKQDIKIFLVHLKETPVTTTTPDLLTRLEPVLINEEYGVDYAVFGFMPGLESAVASLAVNVPGTLISDIYGTSIENLPIMEGIKTGEDIDLVIQTGLGYFSNYYLRHWQAVYGTPIIVMGHSGALTEMGYYLSGQYTALIGGSVEGGMLEFLMNEPGLGLQSSDIMSFGHVFLILLLVIGNIINVYNIYIKKVGGSK